jgi:hypothetical protein
LLTDERRWRKLEKETALPLQRFKKRTRRPVHPALLMPNRPKIFNITARRSIRHYVVPNRLQQEQQTCFRVMD